MFFCILFNYTILRDTKDVLMVTAPKSGAEVIPFIKTYVNLPAAIVSFDDVNNFSPFFSGSSTVYFCISNVGFYWIVCQHVQQNGTQKCLLCLRLALFGILLLVCFGGLPEPCLFASSWIGRFVGQPFASRIFSTLGDYSQLEFCTLLCHGRDVGKCRDVPSLLGICQ